MNIIPLIIIFFVPARSFVPGGGVGKDHRGDVRLSDQVWPCRSQFETAQKQKPAWGEDLFHFKYFVIIAKKKVIGKKYMKKVDCIISKFSKEIDAADELFETKCDDPPVEDSLPPISGSIYWSQGIGQF